MKKWMFIVIALAAFAGGCSSHLYSPPARISPLETPDTLGDGESSVEVQAGVGGQIFGPSALKVGGQYSRGLSEELELDGEFNVAMLDGDPDGPEDELAVDHHPNIYTSRLSLKWAPESLGGHVAVIGGVGGGAHAAGGFLSPDAGVVVGWNGIVKPFLSASVFASQPVSVKELDMRTNQDTEPVLKSPEFTYGYSAAAGVGIPVKKVDLMLGFSLDHLQDDEQFGRWVGFNLGFRGRFE